jgi:MFS family permease
MSIKQLLGWCACYLVIETGIAAIVGLMPLFLQQFEANESTIGLILASSYLSLAVSNVFAGWLSDRVQRRKTFLILSGVIAAPLAWGLSEADSTTTVMLLMAGLWFVTGIALTMTTILAGLFTESRYRGRVFGLLSVSANIGLMTGALFSGRIVDRWGYPALFIVMAILYLIIPLVGVFLKDRPAAVDLGDFQPEDSPETPFTARTSFYNRSFVLLIVASVLAQAANSVIFLSRPLIMDTYRFDATTITSVSAYGNLVTLPLPLIFAWLADRTGRKSVLFLSLLGPLLGLLIMLGAGQAWQFWLTSTFGAFVGSGGVIAQAYITDTFPRQSLGRALAIFSATPWIGIVIGLGAGGEAIRRFEMTPALWMAVSVAVVALVLLLPISLSKAKSKRQPLPSDPIVSALRE